MGDGIFGELGAVNHMRAVQGDPWLWYNHAEALGISASRCAYPMKRVGRFKRGQLLGYCTEDRSIVVSACDGEFFVGWHEIAHACVEDRTAESARWINEYDRFHRLEEMFADSVAEFACDRFGYEPRTRRNWTGSGYVEPHALILFRRLIERGGL